MKARIIILLLFITSSFIIPQIVTWTEINSPFSSRVRVLHLKLPNTLFAGGEIGFFRTTDLGQSWDTLITEDSRSLYIFNDSTWYLSTYGGIYLTMDYGENWNPFGLTIPTLSINDIAVNRNDNSIFGATTTGLYKSVNNGTTWAFISNGYPGAGFENREIESIGDTIIVFGKNDNSSAEWDIFRSTDNGNSWTLYDFENFYLGGIFKSKEDVLFLKYHDYQDLIRLYRSTNGGEYWSIIRESSGYPFYYYGPMINSLNNSIVMGTRSVHNLGAFINLEVSFDNFDTRSFYRGIWAVNSITSLTYNFNEEIFAGLVQGSIRKIIGVTLPIELITFNAEVYNNKIKLTWETATELNNHGFEIQKSINNEEYFAVGFIKGNGTTSETKYYEFLDPNPVIGKNYYRLIQMDYDGRTITSDTIEVSYNFIKNFYISQNYPNPFNPSTTINFQIPELSLVTLKIYDVLGKEIVTLVNEEKPAGNYQIEFDGTALPSGIYFYRLQAGEFVEAKKMILLK